MRIECFDVDKLCCPYVEVTSNDGASKKFRSKMGTYQMLEQITLSGRRAYKKVGRLEKKKTYFEIFVSVTTFGKITPHTSEIINVFVQYFESLFKLWQKMKLVCNVLCCWVHFHCYKWSNIKKSKRHLAKLIFATNACRRHRKENILIVIGQSISKVFDLI